MFAIQGDLNDPQLVLSEPEWSEFDAAIISMALHHVKDPVGFLSRLRKRVRRGGALVVVDFLQQSSTPTAATLLSITEETTSMMQRI